MNPFRVSLVTLAGMVALAACGSTTTSVSSGPATSATPLPVATATPDPTAGWKSVTSPSGNFTLRYGPEWSAVICDPTIKVSWGTPQRPPAVFLFPTHPTPPSECPAEIGGGDPVASFEVVDRPENGGACGTTVVSTAPVASANGVMGTVSKLGPSTESCQGSPYGPGAIYNFTTAGKNFAVMYLSQPGDDRTALVAQIVTTTLVLPK